MNPNFNIIVAHDLNLGIGINNQLLCHLPEDMKYFKNLTSTTKDPKKQNIVIIGRKTYDSINDRFKPLINRVNIVITRNNNLQFDDVHTVTSIEDALDLSQTLIKECKAENIFCIGGSSIYSTMIKHPQCQTLYITEIGHKFTSDSFFPEYKKEFQETYKSNTLTSKNNISYRFKTYNKLIKS